MIVLEEPEKHGWNLVFLTINTSRIYWEVTGSFSSGVILISLDNGVNNSLHGENIEISQCCQGKKVFCRRRGNFENASSPGHHNSHTYMSFSHGSPTVTQLTSPFRCKLTWMHTKTHTLHIYLVRYHVTSFGLFNWSMYVHMRSRMLTSNFDTIRCVSWRLTRSLFSWKLKLHAVSQWWKGEGVVSLPTTQPF